MSEIVVTPMEPDHYGVQVTEGDLTTSHRVTVPPRFLDELGVTDTDPTLVVEETIGFLLDREPGPAIRDEFSLDDVAREFPDFSEELLTRLSG